MNRKERRAQARTGGAPGQAAAGGNDPQLAQALAAHSSGNLAAAQQGYQAVLQRQPDNSQALHNLGLLAAQAGEYPAAIELVQRALKVKPRNAAAQRDLGKILYAAGQLQPAAEALESAVKLAPRDAEALALLGACRTALGEGEAGERACRKALKLAPEHPDVVLQLANAQAWQQKFDAAIATYRKLLKQQPDHAQALHNLARCYYNQAMAQVGQGEMEPAGESLRLALEIDASFADAWSNLGSLLNQLGRPDEAEAACRRALELNPQDVDARANLALILEHASRLDDALAEAEAGLEQAPEHPWLRLAAAKVERRQGRGDAALQRFSGLEAPAEGSLPLRLDWHFEQGRLFDRQGEPDAAMAAFHAGNRLARQLAEQRFSAPGSRPRGITRQRMAALSARITPERVANWTPITAPSAEDSPVFLVGFPRSGTTLLHHVLESHPRLRVAEEVEALLSAETALVGDHKGADDYSGWLDRLESLDEEAAQAARQAYLETLTAGLPDKPQVHTGEEARTVDKLPLNILRLGEIHRLYPQAKIILALRHPCDVCLSAYMQNFDLNDAMAHFTDLEETGRFYAETMTLYRRVREVLPLDVHALRYEDLIDDFDGTVGQLLDFLELDWDERVRDFAETARKRQRIDTPSYSQVTEGLYDRARYRWERYRDHLAPVIAQVRPFLPAFGYPEV
ncbi:tetratricopeptide repeat-containing sulfotransferase family protein [Fodinicurvata fenggangensis]|uniref:tetratricopeptide repeat-containing sulfotransferase family protein n=1 Tax=Fodinicurvata fenggangensis TaxID=1121830 RepID=UPI00047EE7B0|nr:tetratricopeptide repeat-containing sulfotransferase family protein [Fodinicurvata fenggangensis]